jgi:hypothetical protein
VWTNNPTKAYHRMQKHKETIKNTVREQEEGAKKDHSWGVRDKYRMSWHAAEAAMVVCMQKVGIRPMSPISNHDQLIMRYLRG